VAKAVVAAVGKDRTGIRLSPYSEFQAMRMKEPEPQFTYLIGELRKLDLAYLHLTTPRVNGAVDNPAPVENLDWAVETWGRGRAVILAGGYTAETAKLDVDGRYKDYDMLIAFGRWFLATPDLPFRIKAGLPPNVYNRKTFYLAQQETGYTDYPFSTEWEQQLAML